MIVNGQERLDGLAVSKWAVRFTGTHDLEIEDAERLALDKVVIFLCATRAGKFEVQVLDDGEVKRKNVATVSDFMVLQGEMRERAISALANGTDHGILNPPVYDGSDNVARLESELAALRSDPRIVGILAGTHVAMEVDTGAVLEHEPAKPTAVQDGEESETELDPIPPHELETDPGWTPADDVGEGWDPRDLPERAPIVEGNQNPDPESEAARAADAEPEPEPEPAPAAEPERVDASVEEPTGPPVGEVVGHINDRSRAPVERGGGRPGPGVGKFDVDTFEHAPEGPAKRTGVPTGRQVVGVGYQHKDPILQEFMDQDVPR